MKKKILLPLAAMMLFFSCKKEEDPAPSVFKLTEGIIILNEGQFNATNASVTYISNKGKVTEDVFSKVNKRPLGDVLQSCMETDESYYLVVNNSGKIEVVNKNTFKSEATIEGFSSPRYMLDLKDGRALVTNFTLDNSAASSIDIVGTETKEIEGSISVVGWCESILLYGDEIYVANTGKNQILVYDKTNLALQTVIPTEPQPTQMVVDKNGKLWVLCLGNFVDVPASLLRVNLSTKAVEEQLDFHKDFGPSRMVANAGANTLFILSTNKTGGVVNGAVYKMSVSTTVSLDIDKIENSDVSAGAYGLAIDVRNDDIYIGDAKDFSSEGTVTHLTYEGTLVETYGAGVAPSGFVFR